MKDEISMIENKLKNNKILKNNNRLIKNTECGKITQKVEDTINFLYYNIIDGYLLANKILENNEIKITYNMINKKNDIKIPTHIDSHFYPKVLRLDMFNNVNFQMTCKFKINHCTITINIITILQNNQTIESKIEELLINIKNMISYLNFAYRLSTCSKTIDNLNIYFYKIDNSKILPYSNTYILDPMHINSAYSHVCNGNEPNLEVVIFRSEEWFKVFIHEIMHAFNLSLSNYQDNFSKILKKIFGINISYLLSESYAEYWARIINIAYKTYSITKNNKIEYLNKFIEFLDLERSFSVLQSNKILQRNNINLSTFTEDTYTINNKLNYKEKTSVFCYYIITSFLLIGNTKTMEWCYNNNNNIINFTKKNEINIEFINLINQIINLKCSKNYILNFMKYSENNNSMFEKNTKTLRMSINKWIE